VEVVTPSKSVRQVSQSPANVIVVTKQQIRERGYVNLADLMEEMPGVDVNRNTTGVYTQISIRGHGGNNNFLIMQNGSRISSPTGELIPVQDNFPLFQAKQVEVVYGPGSALYGADAYAGVINIITEDAKTIDGAEMSGSAGNFDRYYSYLNFGKKATEKLDVTFGGHWQDAENPDLSQFYEGAFQKRSLTSSGRTLVAAENREPFIAPTNSYSAYAKIDYDEKLTVGMTRSFFSHPSTTGFRPVQTKFGENAVLNTAIDTYNGKYKHSFSDSLKSETMIDYASYELLPDSMFSNVAPAFTSYKYAKSSKVKFEEQVNYSVNKDHDLVGGLSYEHFDALPRTPDLPQMYNTSLGSSAQNQFFPNTNNTVPIKIYEVDWENYGSYLQLESRWTSQVTTVLGLRHDHNTRFADTFNPRAGVIIKPAESTVFKLLYGESYRMPPAEFSYRLFGSFTGARNARGEYISNFFNLPNPNLNPEKLRQVEANLSHNLTPNFVVQVSGYYIIVSDAIAGVSVSEPSNSIIPGAQILAYAQFQNFGNRNIFGSELRADYQINFNRANMKFWGNYSWVDGREDLPAGGTGPLGLVARNKVKGGTTIRYMEKYFITPKFEWVDQTSQFASSGMNKTPSYALFNLHAGADNLYKGLTPFIDIRNLTDERYFNTTALRGAFEATPQDPRKIVVGLIYKY
jgi:iron complex outermembrane receptor protein